MTDHTFVSPEQATTEKGYPHPGSVIDLEIGGMIHLQYGHPKEVGRNGCFMHDVLQGIIDNLCVYQEDGHPLACEQTERTIAHLIDAKNSILERRTNRQGRGVHETDKP